MKFLVLGCNGMAGHLISLYLHENGHEVLGVARTKSTLVNSVIGDATDSACIKDLVGINKFDAIVNCIGVLNQFAENSHANAAYVNAFFPHYLAELTEGTKTQIIHMSTDCVFSGEKGQYVEDDVTDGKTFYDRSKALGELNDTKNITLRNSIVGPDIKKNGIGLLNWFMQQHGEINGYTKAIWTGQTTLQLAKTIERVATEKVCGLYNMVPDSSISKFDLLNLFNKYLKKSNDKVEIVPSDKVVLDKSLKRTNWDFDYKIPDYETMIIELREWMATHKSLYPHYDI